MKTLLFKQFTIVITLVSTVFTISAQVPGHLPFSKKKIFNYSKDNKLLSDTKLGSALTHNDKVPCLNKQTTLGGSGDDYASKLIPTSDGGFIVAGGTNSQDGDFRVPAANGEDAFIAKYNKQRQLEWTKTFGGTGDDLFNDIVHTFDGGYLAAGYSSSADGDVTGNHGGYDVWIVKLTATGKMEWQKNYGGSGDDYANGVIQTFYGSYAIGAVTTSNDGDVSGNHGDYDAWIVQLGPKGNLLSQHCYGGSGADDAYAITNSEEGLLFDGGTYSNDGDVTNNHGDQDAWVVKINLSGKIIWQKTVGGSNYDEPSSYAIAKATDGNIVIDGFSFSTDGDINGKDTLVSFLTKINPSTGNIIWSKSYAKPGERGGFGIFATRDGGVVEVGAVGVIGVPSTFDALVSKFDADGNEEWYKVLGGSDYDAGITNGYESLDGSLHILCSTSSTDGDIKKSDGGVDTWLIKLGRCGEEEKEDEAKPGAIASDIKSNTAALSVYPNPASNSATISFGLSQSQKVTLTIYDMDGRLIKTLADAQMQPGTHQFTWNAKSENVTAGMYVVKMQVDNQMQTQKIYVVH